MNVRLPATVALTLAFAVACSAPVPEPSVAPTPSPTRVSGDERPSVVLPDGTRVALEVAIARDELERGLRYRASLPEDLGMIFLLPPGVPPMAEMLDTWIALDLVFLDPAGTVVTVIHEAPPCRDEPCPRYSAGGPAVALLELAAGVAAKHGVEPGSVLGFENVATYPSTTARSGDDDRAAIR